MKYCRTYLAQQVAEWIVAELRKGRWQRELPSERSMADHFGVSRNTIRGALDILAHTGAVRVVDKRRVPTALDMPPMGEIRKTAIMITSNPTIQLPDTHGSYQRIEHYFELADVEVRRETLPQRLNADKWMKTICQQHRDAAVWLLVSVPLHIQRWVERHSLPALIVGSRHNGVSLPDVDVDYRALGRHAVNNLWRLGHRRIVFLSPATVYAGDLAGERGYNEALTVLTGKQLSARIVRHRGDTDSINQILSRIFAETSPPTALMVAKAWYAITVMGCVTQMGRRIPQDVSIVCRDDNPLLSFTFPSLARYSVDLDRLARRAVQQALMLARGQSVLPAPTLRIIPRFIAGDSLARIIH